MQDFYFLNRGVVNDPVCGICARINSSKVYEKLVSVKNRLSTKSFPVMCSNIEQIKSFATIDEKAIKR